MDGRDDNPLDEAQAETVFRSLLVQVGEPRIQMPPADLVSRTMRHLPQASPQVAAREALRGGVVRWVLAVCCGVIVLLGIFLGIVVMVGGARFRWVFGDGQGTFGQVMVIAHLIAKPLVHMVGGGGGALLLAEFVAVLGGGWVWWWLLRRTPIYALEESRS